MPVYESGDFSGKNPVWYWYDGLHDARIKSAKSIKEDFVIVLDTSGVVGNREIKSISFENYKIRTSTFEMSWHWWLQDKLYFENGRFVIDILLTDENEKHKHLIVEFDDAKIEI